MATVRSNGRLPGCHKCRGNNDDAIAAEEKLSSTVVKTSHTVYYLYVRRHQSSEKHVQRCRGAGCFLWPRQHSESGTPSCPPARRGTGSCCVAAVPVRSRAAVRPRGPPWSEGPVHGGRDRPGHGGRSAPATFAPPPLPYLYSHPFFVSSTSLLHPPPRMHTYG